MPNYHCHSNTAVARCNLNSDSLLILWEIPLLNYSQKVKPQLQNLKSHFFSFFLQFIPFKNRVNQSIFLSYPWFQFEIKILFTTSSIWSKRQPTQFGRKMEEIFLLRIYFMKKRLFYRPVMNQNRLSWNGLGIELGLWVTPWLND